MTKIETAALPLGLYRLHWKSGGYSLASVGLLNDGTRWFAPCNWTSKDKTGILSTDWRAVKRAARINAGNTNSTEG